MHASRALFVFGLACAACRDAGPPPERPLEIVIPTDLATLDPRYATRGLDIKTTRLIHAGLVGLEPATLAPVPLVAAKWSFLDERTLELELKPGVRFHSGRALSSADVCATLTALNDPKLGSPHRAVVRAIESCETPSEARVRVRLGSARATLLTDLEVPILRADEARVPPRPGGALDGLGPYRLVQGESGAVALEPADTGVLPRPAHAVVVRTVRDENARALRLLAGRADIAPNALSPNLLPAFEGRAGLSIEARQGANVTYLLMQNERPPFDRPEVRRAIARAIDRASIVRSLLAGRGRVAAWLFPPDHWCAPEGIHPEPFDPAAARAVLSGLRPITLVTSTDRLRLTIARSIAQMLGDAGLETRVVSLDLGVLLERLDSGDFEIATLQMPELTEPNLLAWFFHPRGVPGEGGEGKNRARWRNVEAGRLLDAAGATVDRTERRRLYGRVAEAMLREMPVVPLWHEDQVAIVSERAKGFGLSAEGRWLAVAGVR